MANNYRQQQHQIKDVIEAMTDSLATFLQADALLNFLPSVDNEVVQKMLTSAETSKEVMHNFLEWLLEEEDSAPVLLEFCGILRNLGEDETMISLEKRSELKNVTVMARLFTELVDGEKFQKVTQDTLELVITTLTDCKMIKKTNINLMELKPMEVFVEILKSIRRNKPKWPLIMWNALEIMQPTLFKATGCRLQEENASVYSSNAPGISEEMQRGPVECCRLQEENASVYSSNTPSISEEMQQGPMESCGLYMENLSVAQSEIDVKKRKLNEQDTDFHINEFLKHFDEKAGSERAMNDKGRQEKNPDPHFSDDDEDEEELHEANNAVPDLKLRDYQIELSEEALYGRNVIIRAPTGSGKTRVATHIIIKHLEQISEKNVKKVCFFARTVPLAVQQHKNISKYLPSKYKTILVTGESGNCLSLAALLPDNDVIVLTPMILQNHLTRGLLKDLSVFTLLVFDECHHTRKSEPYNTLMLSYLKMKRDNPSSPLPQVLGLTASLPTERANSIEEATESVLQLCANLAVDYIATVENHIDELKSTVPDPNEEIEVLDKQENKTFVKEVNAIMHDLEKEARKEGTAIDSCVVAKLLGEIPPDRQSQQYSQWTVDLRKAAECVPLSEFETNMSVRNLMVVTKFLMVYNVALEAFDLVHVRDVLAYLALCFKPFMENDDNPEREASLLRDFKDLKSVMESFQPEENSNLTKLEETIEKYVVSKGEDSRGIVFVTTRALAKALTDWLNRCENQAVMNLKAAIFTGTNTPESEGGMTLAQQEACLDRFRKGENRLLIATSVGEEGIDVPECNLVVKYNYVGNEISTIQAKGRSRKKGGQSILLAMPSLLSRELKNRERVNMMYTAVKRVREMSAADRLKWIGRFQQEALRKHEALNLARGSRKSDKRFRMVCRWCRQTCVDSDYIRTINGVHRVVIDWNIWKYTRPRHTIEIHIDDIRSVGSVKCNASVQGEGICGGPLGAAIMYKGAVFLAAGVKNFGFVEDGTDVPEFKKKWKDVEYAVPQISFSDLKSYMEDCHRSKASSQ